MLPGMWEENDPTPIGLAWRIVRRRGLNKAARLTLSPLPQVTLEDVGTISFQVGSCNSEAQLRVTGKQPPPIPGKVMSPCPSLVKELLGVVWSESQVFQQLSCLG